MPTRIITADQIQLLKVGDILQKSTPYHTHKKRFGNAAIENLVTYEIRSINKKSNTISFEVRDDKSLFSWPSDLYRMVVDMEKILTEDIWWLIDQNADL